MNTLPEKLKQLRVNSNLTQEELAKKLFVTRQAISNWENGKNMPDTVAIVSLSRLYGVSLDELLKGEHQMIKNMKNELEQINTMDKLVLIFMSVLSFALPVIGLVTGIYLFLKSKVYPTWVRIIAVTAVLYQITLILYFILMLIFAMHNPSLDTTTLTNTNLSD